MVNEYPNRPLSPPAAGIKWRNFPGIDPSTAFAVSEVCFPIGYRRPAAPPDRGSGREQHAGRNAQRGVQAVCQRALTTRCSSVTTASRREEAAQEERSRAAFCLNYATISLRRGG
jgi:hypothetical protein